MFSWSASAKPALVTARCTSHARVVDIDVYLLERVEPLLAEAVGQVMDSAPASHSS